jgi:O-antigen ligase
LTNSQAMTKSRTHAIRDSVTGKAAAIISQTPIQLNILAVSLLLSFDLQFDAGIGTYIFVDFAFPFLLIPVFVYAWKRKLRLRWEPCLVVLPWLFEAVLTTAYRALNPHWFWGFSARFAMALLYAIAIRNSDGLKSVFVLSWMLVPMSIYGVYQVLIDDPGPLYRIINPHFIDRNWMSRATGFFYSDNMFGGFCAILLPFLFLLAAKAEKTATRFTAATLAVFGFIGLGASASRGAVIGLACAGIYWFFASAMKFRRKLLLLSLTVALGSVAVMSNVGTIYRLLHVNEAESVGTRLILSIAAIQMFLAHPIIGEGFTNFGELVGGWTDDPALAGLAAHDTYLHLLAENGAVGFLCFFLPLLYLFYRNLKDARRYPLSMACSAAWIVFLIHCLTDYLIGEAQYLYLLMLLIGLSCNVFDIGKPSGERKTRGAA